MSTPEGRAVVWDILARSGMMAKTYVPGDPVASTYYQGRREAALELYSDVAGRFPAYLLEMEKENMR